MKIKEYNRDYIESSIKNGKSYLELGREYGVSDTMIKKYARRNGISLPKRRKINPNETFNEGIKLKEESPANGRVKDSIPFV